MLTSFRLRFAAAALLVFALPLPQAHAVNKDMVQLQTQVQQLLDAVARLQQSNDERMGVMKDLVQQTADSVNKMSLTVGSLEQKLAVQQEANAAKTDQLSGQIQSLNDTLDELKARMAKLDRALATIQSQEQSNAALLQNLPGTNPGAGATPDTTAGPATAPQQQMADNTPAPVVPVGRKPAAGVPAGPGPDALYRAALGDYMAAKYPLAAGEFTDLINQYPDDNLAGNAYYYLGEINSKSAKPSAAVKDYDHLLERYPDNQKIPAAHLHKAEALIAVRQTDAGIREFRALIQRFPNSPESAQARSKLNAMGARTR